MTELDATIGLRQLARAPQQSLWLVAGDPARAELVGPRASAGDAEVEPIEVPVPTTPTTIDVVLHPLTPLPRDLVVAEQADPGWHGSLDGRPLELVRRLQGDALGAGRDHREPDGVASQHVADRRGRPARGARGAPAALAAQAPGGRPGRGGEPGSTCDRSGPVPARAAGRATVAPTRNPADLEPGRCPGRPGPPPRQPGRPGNPGDPARRAIPALRAAPGVRDETGRAGRPRVRRDGGGHGGPGRRPGATLRRLPAGDQHADRLPAAHGRRTGDERAGCPGRGGGAGLGPPRTRRRSVRARPRCGRSARARTSSGWPRRARRSRCARSGARSPPS